MRLVVGCLAQIQKLCLFKFQKSLIDNILLHIKRLRKVCVTVHVKFISTGIYSMINLSVSEKKMKTEDPSKIENEFLYER